MNILVGRKDEIAQIEQCYKSQQSEFVVVYGRRRIGKTYLVNKTFKDRFAFRYVGGHNLTESEQLRNFALALKEYSKTTYLSPISSWIDAFEMLRQFLSALPTKRRKVIFIDEMPWIDTPGSKFVKAFENFWNGWAALRDDILLVASGSATSWMADKLFANQGGLYNRVTRQIYLRPFTLAEVEKYMLSKGGKWDRYQVLQLYMVMGGIPYYLSLVDFKKSLAQNIDELFFAKNAKLRMEFDELYKVLFNSADKYISIVKALSETKSGLTRQQLSEKTNMQGGVFSKMLSNLERCDFVISFAHYNRKIKNTIYKLSDPYTLFYFRFIENDKSKDPHYWTHNINRPSLSVWQGYTFELVCLLHIEQIKQKLGISGMATAVSTWRDNTSQIDLIIDRADRMLNVCEMKFSVLPYTLEKKYYDKILERTAVFCSTAKVTKGVLQTFVTTYGLSDNKYSSLIDSQVVADDLFV
ncbi:MAG: AAA family ATPase [Paludibacteraceae bacterium]|nr:AAA family ATPase [Paludibacteraceae bacterium]